MDYFQYQGQQLFAEQVAVSDIAKRHGTPTYVYSRKTIERHWHAFNDSFADYPHLICYAVKACSNLAILNLMAKMGSGFDIVSEGELRRVLAAGGDASKVVFSGVGKTLSEIRFALEQGISCFNIESIAEVDKINQVAQSLGKVAPVAIRVNPDVDANTHPYISTGLKENKFGVSIDVAEELYARAASLPGLKVKGIACHIGSQLTTLKPFLDALDRVLLLADSLKAKGINIEHLDIGGGLGVTYRDEQPPLPADYAKAVLEKIRPTGYHIHMEPGRAIMANAGVLLTEVQLLKNNEQKHFIVVDAAMNDLLRPSLYSAWQEIVPAIKSDQTEAVQFADVVGPVCETGDFLGKDRALAVREGDLLVVRSAGAYGFSMSSNYNSRPRATEVLVDGDQMYCIRERESFEDMIRGEHVLDL